MSKVKILAVEDEEVSRRVLKLALEAGCSAYATKPFRIADLRARIAALLDE